MDEHELSRRLSDAAASPARPVDLAGIEAGIAKRRRNRRAVVGSAAASMLLLAGLAAFALFDRDDSQEVIVGTDPTTTTTTAGEDGSTFSGEWAGYVPAQPPVGVVIAVDDGLSFLDLEAGSEFWAPDMGFADLADVPGLESTVSSRVPQVADGEFRWWDPHASGWSVHADLGAPLAYGGWVGGPAGFLTDAGGQVLVEDAAARWWLSHDMRVVSWAACESGCDFEAYDSLTRKIETLPDGCWVAAAEGDDRVFICDEGATVVVGGERVDVGETVGGEPAQAVAAWPNGMVWLDHGTCHASEALRILDGEVRSLLTEPRLSGPSAIPLAMAPDGRAIVHLNAAACDAMDPEPGVYLVDMDTLERDRIWSGAALPGEVRAWWPAPPRPWVIPEGTTEVEFGDLDGRFVTFGQEGVGVVVDGEVDWWWTEGPVAAASSDGDGGVVFQDASDGSDPEAPTGAIRWLDAGGSTPQILVEAGTRTTLRQVVPLDGEVTVLFTRWTGPPNIDEGREELVALPLAGAGERVLAVTGFWGDSALDAVALTDVGLVTSTCHLQCILRRVEGGVDGTTVQHSDWTSGLDGHGRVLAFVGFLAPLGPAGYPEEPVLRLIDAISAPTEEQRAAELLAEVRLPYDPDAPGWGWVDLSDDGRSALVVTPRIVPQEPDRYDVLLVTGLDTTSPRVQMVRTDHALRFG